MFGTRRPGMLSTLKARLWPNVHGFRCQPTRVAGFIPVLFVSVVIGLAYFTAVPATLIPMSRVHPRLAVILLCTFHFVYFNVLVNYLLLVFADPGFVPDDWKAPVPPYMALPEDRSMISHETSDDDLRDLDMEEQLALHKHPLLCRQNADDNVLRARLELQNQFPLSHLMLERNFDGRLRYCRHCSQYKPDRAHHCRVCGRCVLHMDHHCVFINNCVGFYNHKFFISFIIYAFVGCLFVTAVGFPAFFYAVGEGSNSVTSSARPPSQPWELDGAQSLHSTTFNAILVVGYIMGRTTIDMCDIVDPIRAPIIIQYDLGGRANCRAVFGSAPLCWIWPTRYGIEGDGISYRRRAESNRVGTFNHDDLEELQRV